MIWKIILSLFRGPARPNSAGVCAFVCGREQLPFSIASCPDKTHKRTRRFGRVPLWRTTAAAGRQAGGVKRSKAVLKIHSTVCHRKLICAQTQHVAFTELRPGREEGGKKSVGESSYVTGWAQWTPFIKCLLNLTPDIKRLGSVFLWQTMTRKNTPQAFCSVLYVRVLDWVVQKENNWWQ